MNPPGGRGIRARSQGRGGRGFSPDPSRLPGSCWALGLEDLGQLGWAGVALWWAQRLLHLLGTWPCFLPALRGGWACGLGEPQFSRLYIGRGSHLHLVLSAVSWGPVHSHLSVIPSQVAPEPEGLECRLLWQLSPRGLRDGLHPQGPAVWAGPDSSRSGCALVPAPSPGPARSLGQVGLPLPQCGSCPLVAMGTAPLTVCFSSRAETTGRPERNSIQQTFTECLLCARP